MGSLESGEVATLVIGLFAAFVLLQAHLERPSAVPRGFLAGSALLLVANVATIAEGFAANQFLDLLEHLCLLAGGAVFLVTARAPGHGRPGAGEGDGTEGPS